jgi:hypothetical protein
MQQAGVGQGQGHKRHPGLQVLGNMQGMTRTVGHSKVGVSSNSNHSSNGSKSRRRMRLSCARVTQHTGHGRTSSVRRELSLASHNNKSRGLNNSRRNSHHSGMMRLDNSSSNDNSSKSNGNSSKGLIQV